MVTKTQDGTKFAHYAAACLQQESKYGVIDAEYDAVRGEAAFDRLIRTFDRGPILDLGMVHGVCSRDILGARAILSRPMLADSGEWEPAIVLGRLDRDNQIQCQGDESDYVRLTATQLRALLAWAKSIGFFAFDARDACAALDRAQWRDANFRESRAAALDSPMAREFLRHLAYHGAEHRTLAGCDAWAVAYAMVDGDPLGPTGRMTADDAARTRLGAMRMIVDGLLARGELIRVGAGEQMTFGLLEGGWQRLNRLSAVAEVA